MTDATPTEESIAAVEASLDDAAAAPEPQRRARSLSLWNYPATYTLLGINLLVYAAMFAYGPVPGMLHQHDLAGVLTASFNIDTLVRFGATNSQLVLAGQWWRLVTGTFVHITLLHIALNMWCLWNLGLFGEPLLGRRGLVVVYLVTGTAGMLLSFALAPANADVTVAGASGAVFGIAGILIVLLSNRRLPFPWEELRRLRSSVIKFAAINLVIGLSTRVINVGISIDNSAHIGGFLSGLALGVPLVPRMTSGRQRYLARQKVAFAIACLVLALFGFAIANYL